MTDPFLPDLHARNKQSFLLGLARAPLARPPALAPMIGASSDPALALLALVGQRQRFNTLAATALDDVPEAARQLHGDPRPILPDVARRSLLRLQTSVEKAAAGQILAIAVDRVMATGYRLHPFDLPDLARHIRSHPDRLGVAERAYLALVASDSDDDARKGLFFERITPDNWTSFAKAQRRAFVIEQRRANPAAARALVEAVWKSEPAPLRLALLEALAIGLSADDKPFLDKLASDRAETVRQLAGLLRSRLEAQASGVSDRIAAAAACFQKPGALAGMLTSVGLGSGLKFVLPADAKDWQAMQAARDRLFTGIALDELARAVGTAPENIVAALPAEEHGIVMLLLDAAIAMQDVATARRIVAQRLSSGVLAMHSTIHLVQKTRVVLTETEANALLSSRAWEDTLSRFKIETMPAGMNDDGTVVGVATLMPKSAVSAFLASIATSPPSITRAARDFTDLTNALPDTGATP